MNTSDNNDIKSTPLGSKSPEAAESKETKHEVAEEEKSVNTEAAGEDVSTEAGTEPNDPASFDDDGYTFPSETTDNSIELAIKQDKEIKKQKVLFFASAFMALLTAIVGVLAVNSSYKPGAHYFTRSPIFTVLTVISPISVIAVIIPYFVFDRKSVTVSACGDRITRLVYLLPTTSAVLCTIICYENETLARLATLTAVAAAISALYFILMTFNAPHALILTAGIGHLLFCVLIIIALYIEPVIEINSDFKLLVQFGAAASILNMIADSRVLLSRASARSFFAFKTAALIFCLLGGAVTVTVFSVGGEVFDRSYLYFAIFYLTQSALAAVSLTSAKTEIGKQA